MTGWDRRAVVGQSRKRRGIKAVQANIDGKLVPGWKARDDHPKQRIPPKPAKLCLDFLGLEFPHPPSSFLPPPPRLTSVHPSMPPTAASRTVKAPGPDAKQLNDLPDEMLSLIFITFAYKAQKADQHLQLMLVCKRWRSVVLSTAILWSSVSFDASHPWPEPKMQAYLERAKAARLSIKMAGSPNYAASVCQRLGTRLNQLSRLDIGTYEGSVKPLWPHIASMKQLQRLEMANRAGQRFVPQSPASPTEIHLPSLRYLCLEAIDMPWRLCHFENLAELRILHYFLQPVVAVEHFLEALGRCQNLRKLSIILRLPYSGVRSTDNQWYMHPLKNHTVYLPKLRQLELCGYVDTQIQSLAMSIQAPELEAAILEGMGDSELEEDWSMFNPYFPTLQHLTLGGWNDAGGLLQRILPVSSRIHSLDLTLPEMEPFDLPATSTPNHGTPGASPSSQTTAIDLVNPTVDGVLARTRLDRLHTLRTRHVPPAVVRRIVDSVPSVKAVQMLLTNTGLEGDEDTQAFSALEEDMAYLRSKVSFGTFGSLSGAERYASQSDKDAGKLLTDADATLGVNVGDLMTDG